MDANGQRPRPVLTVVRGVPGSGKTTWAKATGRLVLENDMFHMAGGKYLWDARRMKDAIAWCMETAERTLSAGMDVVVANTFTKARHVRAYEALAARAGAGFEVVRCEGRFGSVHAVPEATLRSMESGFEDWPGEKIVVNGRPDGETSGPKPGIIPA